MPPDGANSKKDALAEAMAAVTSQTKEDSSTATTTMTGAKDGEVEAEMDGASALAGRLTNHKSPPCANDSPEKCLVLTLTSGESALVAAGNFGPAVKVSGLLRVFF